MTLSGIEPATFRLVVQCLNQLRHRVPPIFFVNHRINCMNVRENYGFLYYFFDKSVQIHYNLRLLFDRFASYCWLYRSTTLTLIVVLRRGDHTFARL
jgi:hypothetical protein